ncbi:GcrA family cell cycle regulator [Oricola sp.]|uniref:GcrA family cell cycle regulator n=1 Tax=Oricola sp. TaxID=1979950 RepID=UPI0025E6E605|nr:GcrA family cell cycle regulator [Oricola sp.]MCI5078151.1 GcrA family cell cycle regulator [Oricola sp.]
MSWTDERVELLKKLWSEGQSASQIAAQLGGVSRNAVIGKVHRLKLSGRAKSVTSSAPKTKRNPAPRPPASRGGGFGGSAGGVGNAIGRTVTTVTHTVGATVMKNEIGAQALAEADTRPIEDVVVPISKQLTLVELSENTCKWPQGDPLSEEFHFCGHASDEGSPYCKYHAKLAYQPSSDRRRAR